MTPSKTVRPIFWRRLGPTGLILLVFLATACSHVTAPPVPRDPAAEALVERLQGINAELTRFKCVGQMTLTSPDQAPQRFRVAIAGQLDERMRIDMLAPFGGSAATLASDGRHIYVVMHGSREYYKGRFGRGSLERILHMDVAVADLLNLLVGRIPITADSRARLQPGGDTEPGRLELFDSRGRLVQRLDLDAALAPLSALWYDRDRQVTHRLRFEGRLQLDGFVLPRRIELTGDAGQGLILRLERYNANGELDPRLFILKNPW